MLSITMSLTCEVSQPGLVPHMLVSQPDLVQETKHRVTRQGIYTAHIHRDRASQLHSANAMYCKSASVLEPMLHGAAPGCIHAVA